MQLLYKREQSRNSMGYIRFKLWAKSELDEEEKRLIDKYSMNEAILINVPQPGLVRNCFLLGLFCFLVLIPIIAFNFYRDIGLGWVGVIVVAALISAVVGFFAYHQLRETIYVKDLIHGRYFKCKSVIELARKEAYLQMITRYFRQVLESAKNWGGTETFPIEPLPPEEAKNTILSGPFLE